MSLLGKQVNKLLRDIKNGKQDSYKILFDLTYNHLKIVACNYLFDSSYVDDVINETYLKIYKYIDSVNLSCDGYNWMCKIVQNVAYDFNQRFEIFEPINKIQSQSYFYEIDEGSFEDNQLLKIIRTFEKMDQELLYMRFWEDKTYAEIGAAKGLSTINVYRKIQALIKKAKNFYKK